MRRGIAVIAVFTFLLLHTPISADGPRLPPQQFDTPLRATRQPSGSVSDGIEGGEVSNPSRGSVPYATVQSAPASTGKVDSAFVQGCAAFKDGEWAAAMMLLRRSTVDPQYDTEGTWYMLIMAEMNGGDAKAAGDDCDMFMMKFPESQYMPVVQYQKGRSLYLLGDYDRCALVLSDFCHQYPESPVYPAALFWIGESFFATANYEEASALYTRVVEEYPKDQKAPEARYRLDTIASRLREEKLLYLLKKTGEDYLETREDYERQMQLGNNERSLGDEGEESERGGSASSDLTEAIRRLKEKALNAQSLMDEGGGK